MRPETESTKDPEFKSLYVIPKYNKLEIQCKHYLSVGRFCRIIPFFLDDDGFRFFARRSLISIFFFFFFTVDPYRKSFKKLRSRVKFPNGHGHQEIKLDLQRNTNISVLNYHHAKVFSPYCTSDKTNFSSAQVTLPTKSCSENCAPRIIV